MEVMTHSKRQAFKNCPRYFYWKHEQRLEHRLKRKGRRRGSIFGDALFVARSAAEQLGEAASVDSAIKGAIRECVTGAYEEIIDEGRYHDQDDLDSLAVEAVKVEVMATEYCRHYGLDQRREIEYDLPLVDPDTNLNSLLYKLGGKIDGVQVTGEKQARIIEDKLTSSIQVAMIERLPLDEQTSEYTDAFAAMGWKADVSFRYTRLPGINPLKPKQYKTKPDYPGETLDEFAERLTEDVQDRPDFYFVEQIIDFPTHHMLDFRRGRWQEIYVIDAARKQAAADQPLRVFYKNTSRCWEFGGCEFIPLCCQYEDAEALYESIEDNPELTVDKIKSGN